jgi:3'-phosphoadenosine 5'-phosphosulfate sulfotransferase (PAPS reductase)/FAD synthetase
LASLQEALDDIGQSDYKHVVSLSGGKDSTALALYLKQNYPQIPAEYVFCDTGVELPETYEYLERLEVILDAEVKRLSGLDLLKVKHKPGRNAFDMWLHEVYGGYLPNPRARWCTRVLKIQPFEKYAEGKKVYSYIGIRGDENRDGYQSKKPPAISEKPNIIPIYPFKDDGIGSFRVFLLFLSAKG